MLNFSVRRGDNVDEELTSFINDSIFKEHLSKVDISAVEEPSNKENKQPRRTGKITSDHSCVINGLKCLLSESATELVSNITEDFFNLAAKPFKPKVVKPSNSVQSPIDMLAPKPVAKEQSAPVDPEQQQLEKKRQIS